ncbi:hypothetical protein CK203_018045 [Vitis vinifera]|uniref:Uncharacterized protein n=1 Tax=Vitis vinifera TaxID=29760 RepID=A0A438JVZ1_VITVI|nr:hypothetical protein CK203_018045 [Vitis vinifera]
MSERVSERTRAAESEEVSEPAGGENVSRAENRRKRKTRSFGVESKSFVLKWRRGEENPNNHHGKQERGIVLGAHGDVQRRTVHGRPSSVH